MSWEIPYTRTAEALIVKSSGTRYEWQDEAENCIVGNMGWCPIDGGYYKAEYDGCSGGYRNEMNERVKQSWREAGWYAAVPIPEQDDADDYDDIPF
ncbi:MAG: hypothetical protein SAK29_09665 [Scytonema sp. PMC 1069.18]|nr:hypothetical protein [Scytonema sp. PMC 1069.18]MEC4887066.1 hypothetical protein [Scytonema sp. PMC 1070.18]